MVDIVDTTIKEYFFRSFMALQLFISVFYNTVSLNSVI